MYFFLTRANSYEHDQNVHSRGEYCSDSVWPTILDPNQNNNKMFVIDLTKPI